MNWLKTSAGIFIALTVTILILGAAASVLVWISTRFGGVYAVLGAVCLLAIVSMIAGYFVVSNE